MHHLHPTELCASTESSIIGERHLRKGLWLRNDQSLLGLHPDPISNNFDLVAQPAAAYRNPHPRGGFTVDRESPAKNDEIDAPAPKIEFCRQSHPLELIWFVKYWPSLVLCHRNQPTLFECVGHL